MGRSSSGPVGRASSRRTRRLVVAAALVALPVALTACEDNQYQETVVRPGGTEGANTTTQEGILLRDVRIATPEEGPYPEGGEAPLEVQVVNNGSTDDRLLEVTTAEADRVVLRTDGGDGRVDVGLPAATTVRLLEPGAHLVLTGLAAPLGPGSVVELQFRFERSGPVTLNVPVATPDERDEREPEDVGHGAEGDEAA